MCIKEVMMKYIVMILAAGMGTRMKSKEPKVLLEVAGKKMISYVVNTAKSIPNKEIVLVINKGEELKNYVADMGVTIAIQEEQRGTANAVEAGLTKIEDQFNGKVLIINGDMPLVDSKTIKDFISNSKKEKISFITTHMRNPTGYGRVLRSTDGAFIKIVEDKDASDQEKRISEINTGIYLFDVKTLIQIIKQVNNNNAQKEYYITSLLNKNSYPHVVDNKGQFLGVNNRCDIAQASKIMWQQRANNLMRQGVSIIDPSNFYMDDSVVIEEGVTIYPNVHLQGETMIHKDSIIYPGNMIINSTIGIGCKVKENCSIESSYVGDYSEIGPMAHLRPGSHLEGNNKIGNFVEIKNTRMGENTKASHLSYLGDAEIGQHVNIGCGAITCNYDGFSKHKTIIEDGAFVGSDVQLVAPVNIGKNVMIGAGSTITKDIPEGALGISRSEQKIIKNWFSRWKSKKNTGKK